MHKNKNDLRDLAENVVSVVTFVAGEIRAHGESSGNHFTDLATDFFSYESCLCILHVLISGQASLRYTGRSEDNGERW